MIVTAVINMTPKKNVIYLSHWFPALENSSTIISLQAKYKKVPPASELKMADIMSDFESSISPINIPLGVDSENNENYHNDYKNRPG